MTDFKDIEAVDVAGKLKVVFEWIGEGWSGDYNEGDPKDEPLLRFTVYRYEPESDQWEQVDDASYCTQVPAATDRSEVGRLAALILSAVKTAGARGQSIKRTCERASWVRPGDQGGW